MLVWFKKLHWIYKAGIALSLIYLVFAGIHEYHGIIKAANEFADADLRICMDGKNTGCDLKRAESYALFTENMGTRVLGTTLIPLPFYWIFTIIAIYFFRILRTGFKNEITWSQMSKAKKILTGTCLFFFFCGLAFIYMWVSSLQEDKKFPVSMGAYYTLTKYPTTNPNYVSLVGTWLPDREPTKMLWDSIQTSMISCSKETNSCHQAIASVSNNTNLMHADLEEYRILKWTDTNIMFAKEALCFNHIFTIDLVTGKTNSIIKNTGEKQCEPVEEVSFSMVNGFDVYWKNRNKEK